MTIDPRFSHTGKEFSRGACLLILLVAGVLAGPGSSASQADQIALSQPLIVKWRYSSDRLTNFTPASDERAIYVPLASGTLVALSAVNGQLAWKADAGGEACAAPVADERNVYLATEYREGEGDQARLRGALRAISKETGVTRWMRTLPAPIRGSMVTSPLRLFAGTDDGRMYAFDKNNGLSVWINQYSPPFTVQPSVFANRVYITIGGGILLALDQATGADVWRYRTRMPVSSAVTVANGVVYFGSTDGFIYAVNELSSKLLWRHRTGASVQSVVLVSNGLIAASLDNFAYLLSLKNGDIVWRQLLPGRIASRPLITNDGALFTPLSTDSAVVLGLKDGRPVNTLPLGEDNSTVAAPVTAAKRLYVTVPHAVIAFAPPQ